MIRGGASIRTQIFVCNRKSNVNFVDNQRQFTNANQRQFTNANRGRPAVSGR